jgi:REP element-mobilizing transposase RayT
MARKPRIKYEGAFYHVITRGNQKQKIFKDPLDHGVDDNRQDIVHKKNRHDIVQSQL